MTTRKVRQPNRPLLHWSMCSKSRISSTAVKPNLGYPFLLDYTLRSILPFHRSVRWDAWLRSYGQLPGIPGSVWTAKVTHFIPCPSIYSNFYLTYIVSPFVLRSPTLLALLGPALSVTSSRHRLAIITCKTPTLRNPTETRIPGATERI